MYFGAPLPGALLDEVEVEHQVQRRDDDDDQADADAERTRACMNDIGMPNGCSTNVSEVDERDGAGRGDDAELEALGRLDRAGPVDRRASSPSMPNVSATAWNTMPG